MRKYVRLTMPMLLLAAVVAVGCGGGSSKTVKIPGGGEVSVSGKLPDNFPKDFPTYSGAKVTTSYSGKSQGISGTVVLWESGDSLDKVKSFFNDQFAKDAWKSSSDGEVNDSSYWAGENKDGTKSFYAGATRVDNKTTITVTIGDKPKDSSSDNTPSSGSSKTSTSSGSSAKKTSTPSDSSSDSGNSESTPVPNTKLPAEVKISKDFPADRVPFPKGARVTSSSSFGGSGSKTYAVELYVKDTPENVGSFFSDELPKHNWTSGFSSESNGEYVETFSGAENATTTEGVTISAAVADDVTGGYTKVSIIVSSNGN